MRHIISFILFVTFILPSESQSLLRGQWQSHFSFSSCFAVEETRSHWVGATISGLIMIDKFEHSIQTITKSEGLSDFGISAIRGIDDRLFVGYTNGNIDIIDRGEIFNINDLKLKPMDGLKRINHFLKIEDLLYCATDFGVMVINLEKMEIKSTYYIGENASAIKVNQLSYDGQYLYAATEKGVLRALAEAADIHVYTAWSLLSKNAAFYSSVVVVDNQVAAVRGEKNQQGTLEILEPNLTTTLSPLLNSYQNIFVKSDQLFVVTRSQVLIYNADLTVQRTISNPIIDGTNFSSNFSDVLLSEGKILIADNSSGLFSFSGEWRRYLPEGPVNNNVQDIKFIGDKLWLVPGGITSAWNNYNRPAFVSVLTPTGWINLTRANTPEFASAIDLLSIASVPKDPSRVMITSWGSGLFEMGLNHGQIGVSNHFFTPENGLVNIFNDHRQYVRVGASAMDKNNVLWMSNSSVENSIVAYFPETGKWQRYSYGAIQNEHGIAPILVAANGDKWALLQRTSSKGLFIWNDNNTPYDQSDDYYKSPIHPSRDADKRNVGQVLLIDSNGEVVTDNVFAIAEDHNQHMWIGTDKGVVVNFQASSIFSQEVPIFSRIKIPRDDGTNFADYLLGNEEVSAIVVDAGNRKWLGTHSSGVFLVSSDGTKQLEEFNVDNSPLPSNFIEAITINDKTGEVFFATANGVVSYKGNATKGADSFSNIYAFPNPVRPNYFDGSGKMITITGLMTKSNVKITDVAGRLVYETESVGGQAFWDGRNLQGATVKTGVYLVFVALADGSLSGVTKIAIVR